MRRRQNFPDVRSEYRGVIESMTETSSAAQVRRVFTAMAVLVLAPPASLRAQGVDPAGSGPINSALLWLQGTLLGTVATTVAVMAVAAIGFMMLTGRMNWRFGATVIIGVFILFGATTIVAGIQSAAG
jgi:type IV secretion system protein VirB2